jgi:serine/threonine protein kinase
MDPPIRLNLHDLQARASSWITASLKTLSRPFFYEAAARWGPEFAIFLTSSADLDNEDGWHPVRPLGQGSFGRVGLWQKIDSDGQVVDSIAIKQQKYGDRREHEEMTLGAHGLSREAALMHQLNNLDNPNIIRLRGFKNNGPEKLWRFYFEYCHGGDLDNLITNYCAWNTYLPEEFLWDVFHGLAHAAQTLQQGPFRDLDTDRSTDNEVVHFDLKPQNVFLDNTAAPTLHGDPRHRTPQIVYYPTVKMADFGLATITGVDDQDNPREYRERGTDLYKPPVRQSLVPCSLLKANYGYRNKPQ